MNKGISLIQYITLIITTAILGNYSMAGLSTEFCIVCFLVWLPTIISNFKFFSSCEKSLVGFSFLFTLIIISYRLIGLTGAPFSALAAYPSWLLIMIVGVTASHIISYEQMRIFFWFFIAFTFINMALFVRTNLELSLMEYYDDIAEAGRTMYGTSIMLVTSILFATFFKAEKLWQKFVFISFCVFSIFTITVVLQKATNVVLVLSSMFLLYVFGRTNNRKKTIAISILAVILLLIIYYSGALFDALNWLSNNVEGRMSSRIQSLAILLQTGNSVEAGSSVAERSELMWRSWNTFIDHFFLGAGDHRGENSLIGNHSELIDNLARYGLIGAIILWGLLKNQFLFLKQDVSKYNNRQLFMQILIVYGLYIFRNFYGAAFSATISVVMFIFFPIAINYILDNNKNLY